MPPAQPVQRPRRKFRAAISDLLARSLLGKRAGLSFGEKRDLYLALGYTEQITTLLYRARYERGGIAERIVEAYPRATWSGGASLVEDPDPAVETEFETQSRLLFDKLDIWARLLRVDTLAGLGQYSILLLGGDGELDSELPKVSGIDGLLYLTPVSEERAKINEVVDDITDPRFGLPKKYQIKLGAVAGQTGTSSSLNKVIHWTRVVHVAEGLLDDDVYGKPRLRSVWNYLDDLDKIVGGGAEAAWKHMHPGMQLDVNPDIEFSDAEQSKLIDELDEFEHGMRRYIRTRGIELKLLSSVVAGFGPNAESVLKLISATTGIPQRILTGSERGELASSQDRSNWNDRISERRREFAIPLVLQLVDRFIEIGILPTPKEYSVVWPAIDELDEAGKAEVAVSLTKANQSQFASEGTIIITSNEIRETILGLGPLDDLDVKGLIAETADEDASEPEWKSIHAVADIHRASLGRLIAKSWRDMAKEVDSIDGIEDALDSVEVNELQPKLETKIHKILSDSAEMALELAKGRGSFKANTLRSAQFEATFDSSNPRAVEWASERSSALITEIGKHTREAIKAMVAQGIEEGIPPRKLLNLIKERIGLRSDQITALNNFALGEVTEAQVQRYARKLLRDRALLIARTETMRSANAGQRELWFQAKDDGLLKSTQKRVWITTPDDRLRDSHAQMEGQTTGIDEPFDPPIEPGEEPNCRCAQGLA